MRLQAVGKRYWKLEEQAMLLRSVVPIWRPSRSELWALRNVDFTIKRGETVGIIGRNGAGKSTMLRLLAGVTQPTEGQVFVQGRIAPLISVGVGFHAEMSGRENIYVNGMLLGLSRREIESRFDEIVAFAELEDFIDTPVKFYSSGMFMRLGFSVAVCSRPDVLLVDEILAVGDVAFQLKSFERMREIQAQGTTIVLVSHSMHAIRLLCPRTLVIGAGHLEFDGATQEAIDRHHRMLSPSPASGDEAEIGPSIRILRRELIGRNGPTFHPSPNELLTYRVRLYFEQPVDNPQVQFQIFSQTGTFVYGRRTFAGLSRRFAAGEQAEIEVCFDQRLGGDTYRLALNILDRAGEPLYLDSDPLLVYVAGRAGAAGLVDLGASILVDGEAFLEEIDLLLDAGTSTTASSP